MGFFNALKGRFKKPSEPELDLPPEPPKLSDLGELPPLPASLDEELRPTPRFPQFPRKKETVEISGGMSPFQDGSPAPKEDLGFPPMEPLFDEDSGLKGRDELGLGNDEFPDFPELPPFPEFPRPAPRPEMMPDKPKSIQPPLRMPSPPMRPEAPRVPPKAALSLPQFPGKKYISLETFKQALQDINSSKSDLRDVHQYVSELVEYLHEETRDYEDWNSSLKDINRKLLYVDKVLFQKAS
ncbi:hypothetical protein HYV84_00890 [Candidatus Woesearchaeota archaeon]|nr:hypothetical protein [Candidatus Woesearchaeota archaeon]